MNDLLPPPRRSIPERRRKRMRKKLDDEIGSAGPQAQRHSAAQRFGVPAVVAAAVAALAIGGYLLAGGDSDGDGGTGVVPAGQGNDATRGPKPSQGPKVDAGFAPPHSTPLADPDAVYDQCIKLVLRQYDLRGEPVDEEPTGKLAIENDTGTTVVVANSTDSYSCNVTPDRAVSHPSALNGTAEAEDFSFALNVTANVLPGASGDMVWVGGEVPDGVTAISYAFPDGHTEEAVVQSGYWAMQYYSTKTIPTGPKDKVEITLEGPSGRTIELPFTINTMCNQVTHGC